MRRRFLPKRLVVVLLAAVLGLSAGCGAGPAPDPTASSAPSHGSATTATAASYPMQLDSPYGTTTLEKAPERVVVVGPNDVETVLGLGVVPVAAAGWGDYDEEDWMPWVDATVIKATLEPIAGGADFEKVLKFKPDLIVAVGGIDDLAKGYPQLARIAPVVTYPEKLENWSTGDPVITLRTIARPLNKVAEAEALLSQYDKKLAEVRGAHPEFDGKTISVVGFSGPDGAWLDSQQGSSVESFLSELGFKANPATARVSGNIPEEKFDLIDADVLVGMAKNGSTDKTIGQVRANPLFAELKVVRNGAFVYLDDSKDGVYVAAPLSAPSVPSKLWLLDVLPGILSPAAKAADSAKK